MEDVTTLETDDRSECLALIASRHVGRVATTVGALPVIVPVVYAVDDGEIVFAMPGGEKLASATDDAVVALEVDSLEGGAGVVDPGRRGWWSVLATGHAAVIDDADADAVDALDALDLPDAFPPETRTFYVRFTPELVSGRRVEHRTNGF